MGPKFSQLLEAPDSYSPDSDLDITAQIKMLDNLAVVMECLVPYINSIQDLLALRRTCQLCNSIVITELRKMSKSRTLELDLSPEWDNGKPMEKFLEVMKSSDDGVPFSKYHLTNCRGSLQGFDTVCWDSVTELTIVGRLTWTWREDPMPIRRDGVVGEILLELLPQDWFQDVDDEYKPLPNLKRLSFFVIDKKVGTECSQLVTKLILAATELEDLRLSYRTYRFRDHDHQSYLLLLRSVLTSIRGFNSNVHKLKRLQVGPVNRRILQLLLELSDDDRGANVLRLEYFLITMTGSGWEDEDDPDLQRHEMNLMLKEFLDRQAPTLKDLEIIFRETLLGRRVNSTILIMLPQLERLETLKITQRYPDNVIGNQSSDESSISFSLTYDGETFAKSFPALTKLQYPFKANHLQPSNAELIEISHPGITNLTLGAYPRHLDLLPTRFPSVTHLQLRLHITAFDLTEEERDELSRVWTMWPKLTHLRLELEILSEAGAVRPDELLTGVPREAMPGLRQELDSLTSSVNHPDPLTLGELDALVGKYRTRPSISDMNRLEELELKWWPRKEIVEESDGGEGSTRLVLQAGSQLTDIAVHLGLALIGPQLKSINILSVANFMTAEFVKIIRGFQPKNVSIAVGEMGLLEVTIPAE